MIVQNAPEGDGADAPRFVIKMAEHTAFAGKLAAHFGNAEFEAVAPREEMLFVAANHDAGWAWWDEAPECDPETGLPYHLVKTPRPVILKTGVRSADYNEAHHPYCGLLASMHIWGLYNGRYGYSDQVLIEQIPEEHRPALDEMLDGQLARQERLKRELAADPKMAPWVAPGPLFRSYKQLQFFDTLALYFNCAPEGSRGESRFTHVPRTAEDADDATVTVSPRGEGVYAFDPYPFDESGLILTFEGRYLRARDCNGDMGRVMSETPTAIQSVTFVAG